MHLSNVLSGSAFRLALRVVAIFVLLLVLAGVMLVQAVSRSLENELVNQAQEEVALFKEIYAAKGVQGLISVINDLSGTSSVEVAQGLFDSNKQHLAGQVSLMPDFIGLRRTTLVLNRKTPGEYVGTFHVGSVKLNEVTLVVGRSTRIVDITRNDLILWLFISGFGLSLGTLLLGYLASARSFSKLQAIDNTLQAVSNGNMQARITMSDDNDQIDRISLQMNRHLDHLSDLVSGMKSTATAIAHDLKTPLSHVRISLFNALDFCDKGADPADAIADALDELEQLNQIFDTILRISRIQSQGDRTAFKQFDLSVLIEKVIDLLTPIAEASNIKLYQQVDKTVPLFMDGDAGMIQQLLVNLVNNALVHCPGGSEVKLSAAQVQGQIVLVVQDNGPGIPVDQREAVLEPFKQLDSARSNSGNGLGLALVKAIAEHHQASMSLDDANPGLLVKLIFR